MLQEDPDLQKGFHSSKLKSIKSILNMLVDPNVNVLATTTFSGEHDSWIENAVIPVIWKKYFGEGRVFYFSVRHSSDMFDIDEPMTIFQRDLMWASGSRYETKESWMSPIYKKKDTK